MNIEELYKNIDKMPDKEFKKYIRSMDREVAKAFKEDLFKNKGLNRFLDIRKTMRCMQIADLAERD